MPKLMFQQEKDEDQLTMGLTTLPRLDNAYEPPEIKVPITAMQVIRKSIHNFVEAGKNCISKSIENFKARESTHCLKQDVTNVPDGDMGPCCSKQSESSIHDQVQDKSVPFRRASFQGGILLQRLSTFQSLSPSTSGQQNVEQVTPVVSSSDVKTTPQKEHKLFKNSLWLRQAQFLKKIGEVVEKQLIQHHCLVQTVLIAATLIFVTSIVAVLFPNLAEPL